MIYQEKLGIMNVNADARPDIGHHRHLQTEPRHSKHGVIDQV